MSSRDDILTRLRARLGRTTTPSKILDTAPISRAAPSIPSRPTSACLLDDFCRRATALASTVEKLETQAEVPAAVARYLSALALPLKAVCWSDLLKLDWSAAGIEVSTHNIKTDDAVGLTGCQFAVAETGSLVLCSGEHTPALLSVLPATHIVVLKASALRADMEAVWQELRLSHETTQVWPRAVNFVSGPSRTGDIEQTIVLGAHGPARVHVLIVCSE